MIKDFPQELKDLKKWLICYGLNVIETEHIKKKAPKTGFKPINEPETLLYFKDIKTDERYQDGDLIGLSLNQTPYFVLDLDNHTDTKDTELEKTHKDIIEIAKSFNLLVTKSASGKGFHIYGKFDSMDTKEKINIGKPELLKNKYACENPKYEIINKVDSLPTNGKEFIDKVKEYIGFNSEPQDTPAPDLSYLKGVKPLAPDTDNMIDFDYMIKEINKQEIDFLPQDGCGKGFVCPFCGSGSHSKNGTGLKRDTTVNNEIRYTCFGSKCNVNNPNNSNGRSRPTYDYLLAKHGFFNNITCEVINPEPNKAKGIITEYANSHGLSIKYKDTSAPSQPKASNPKTEPSPQNPINKNNGSSDIVETLENPQEFVSKHTIKYYLDNDYNDYTLSNIKTPTGLIDDLLNGGLPIGLTILGAITSIGKTTFISQIAENIANNGTYVLYYSLENSKGNLIDKGLLRQLFKNNEIGTDKNNLKNTNRYIDYVKDKLLILDNNDQFFTVFNIKQDIEKIKKLNSNNKIVVFVDYLQLLQPLKPNGFEINDRLDIRQATDNVVSGLMNLARDYKIPIVAISSLNRASYYKRVERDSFKESGKIEYSSDLIIGLNYCNMDDKDDKNTNNRNVVNEQQLKTDLPRDIEVSVIKYRNDRINEPQRLYFYSKYACFVKDLNDEQKKEIDKAKSDKP